MFTGCLCKLDSLVLVPLSHVKNIHEKVKQLHTRDPHHNKSVDANEKSALYKNVTLTRLTFLKHLTQDGS